MAKYIYPAIFHEAKEGGYWVEFMDLPNGTEGDDLQEAFDMAKDSLCLQLYSYEVDGLPIPAATKLEAVVFEGPGFASYITCDTMEYRRYFNNKAVKKTLTIPEWLNTEATNKGINFSATLQQALMKELGLEY